MKNTTVREDVREIKDILGTLVGAVDTLALQVFDLRIDVDEIKTGMMTKKDKEEILKNMMRKLNNCRLQLRK